MDSSTCYVSGGVQRKNIQMYQVVNEDRRMNLIQDSCTDSNSLTLTIFWVPMLDSWFFIYYLES